MKLKFRGTATGKRYKKGKVYEGYLNFSYVTQEYQIMFEDEHGWNFVPVEQDTIEQVKEVASNDAT